ncbi:isoform 2 of 4-hydroxy-tetrahydrodipicolinate synthase 1 [Populus alba x Populus x berolinensis]|nr:isoform 2 of 4-hydroxy-tetrahydrodipicolinate synthase 1 [Populus alba x Populus x berolinensis]
MAAMKSYSACLRESTLQFPRPNCGDNYKRRGGKWRSPQAAVIPDLRLPMRSFEVKNRQDNNNNNNNSNNNNKLLSIL